MQATNATGGASELLSAMYFGGVRAHISHHVSPQRISCCYELQWQHWQVDGGFGLYMSLLDDTVTDSDNSDGSSMQHATEDSLYATQQ